MPRRFRSISRTTLLAAPLALLVLAASGGPALAAGYQRAEIAATSGDPALAAIIWYPCDGPVAGTQLGPYPIAADEGCEVVGRDLPLVAISHGQGGSYLGHHDTAVALANAGFVVVSVNHPGDNFSDESAAQTIEVFATRPRDISRAITHVLSQWPQRDRVDAGAVGVFGFSRGGYTALVLAGATPSMSAAAARFCGAWWSFVNALCRALEADGAAIDARADPRIRAAVVVDPLHLFDAAGPATVTAPVQLWASGEGGDGVELAHVEAIRDTLPTPPEFHVVQGAGHFAFLAPCTPALAGSAPRICEDPDGFDRADLHRTMNEAVVGFFNRHLRPADGAAPATRGAAPGR